MNVQSAACLTSIGTRLKKLARWALQGTQTQKTLQYIEWTIIAFSAVVYGFFSGPILDIVYPRWGPFPFLLIWFALSFIFPDDRPRWQRRLYIFIEIAVMIVAISINLAIETLIFVFIAKACFLLSRRDVVITVILTGIAQHIPLLWLIPRHLEYRQLNPQEVFDPQRTMIMSWVESVFTYATAITFVLLLCFTILSEQKAQKRAKKLVEEIETLSTMLERERIARDIHDTLGHTLTTLNIQLEVAQQIGASSIAQTLQRVEMAKQLADQCLRDVRQTVQTMREDNFNLTQALGALMEQIQHTQSLTNQPIQLDVKLRLPPLSLHISYQLYRTIQEGVTNIQKHAQATQIQLKGWATTNSLHIELSDNGQGFDLTQPAKGYGVKGMQERVQMLGGTLQIQTTVGQGTKLFIQVPISTTSVLTPLMPEVSQ